MSSFYFFLKWLYWSIEIIGFGRGSVGVADLFGAGLGMVRTEPFQGRTITIVPQHRIFAWGEEFKERALPGRVLRFA